VSSDRASMLYLYKNNLLSGVTYNKLIMELSEKNQKLQNKVDKFWNCFNISIQMNDRGLDNKQRILSVIADHFTYYELQDNLKVIFIKKLIFTQ
jgi:hypothetical protein